MKRALMLCASLAVVLASPATLSAATAPPPATPAAASAPAAPFLATLLPSTPAPIPMTCTATTCAQAAVYANNLCHQGILECLDQFTCDPAHPCSFTYSCQPC